MAALFAAGLAIRLIHLDQPPLDFHPTRQYRSAIIAHGYYFAGLSAVPQWEKDVAELNKQGQWTLEPPLLELMAATAYRLTGVERLWMPRLLSSLFWLAGGAFLYTIARQLASTDAAVVSTAVYLLLPFGISASRTFMPDPLMVAAWLGSVWAMVRYFDRPTRAALWLVSLAVALAVFTKPVAIFFVFGAFVALVVARRGLRSAVKDRHLFVFATVSLLPAALYYLYGILTGTFGQGQVEERFIPALFTYPEFWGNWGGMLVRVVGLPALVGALLGLFLFPPGWRRTLILGLWAGYLAFGLVFNYHIHSHDYYSLPLVPIVALSLGPLGATILGRLHDATGRRQPRALVLAILAVAVLLHLDQVQQGTIVADAERYVRIRQEIGETVGHSTKTLFLSQDYGKPLMYYGELSGHSWPNAGDLQLYRLQGHPDKTAEERFDSEFLPLALEYFIVTDLAALGEQRDLQRLLFQRFRPIAQTPQYLVFQLTGTS